MKAPTSLLWLTSLFEVTKFVVRGDGQFYYELEIDKDLITASNELVTFTGETNGTISFCARVDTWLDGLDGDINVAFKETAYNINFDTSNVGLDGLGGDDDYFGNNTGGGGLIEIIPPGGDGNSTTGPTDTFNSTVTLVKVVGCVCSASSFFCTPRADIQPVGPNSNMHICLSPDSNTVNITNFNLQLVNSAVPFSYQPVEYGTDTWAHDILTTVDEGQRGNNIDVVRTKLFLVAGLFDSEGSISVSGDVFFSRKNFASSRMMENKGYSLEIEIIPNDLNDEDDDLELLGFFAMLMNLLRALLSLFF